MNIENNKKKYIEYIEGEKNLPLFSRPEWLDIVAKNCWDVFIVTKGDRIVASFPFVMQKNKILMPAFTPRLGVYFWQQEEESISEKDKRVITELVVSSIPKCHSFLMRFSYEFTDWLPFYWENYEQTTLYSYILDDISDVDSLQKTFSHAKRKNIKKAKKSLNVYEDLELNTFYEHHKKSLAEQGRLISYSYDLFQEIYSCGEEKKFSKTFYAKNDDEIVACIMIVYDNNTAYFLISSILPKHRNSGALTLLVLEALRFFSGKVKRFDFEGSMIKGVENSFRQFGTQQCSYFLITKKNTKLEKIKKMIKYLK